MNRRVQLHSVLSASIELTGTHTLTHIPAFLRLGCFTFFPERLSCGTDVTVWWLPSYQQPTSTHSKSIQRKTLSLCPAHPVQHVGPALHGYTLEHRQHGKGKVVKVGDAVVWALPSHFAHCPVEHTMSAIRCIGCTWGRLFFCNGGCDERNNVRREMFILKCMNGCQFQQSLAFSVERFHFNVLCELKLFWFFGTRF